MNDFSNRIILRLDTVDSTNKFVLGWAEHDSPPEGSVALTRNQTAGRGQKGTEWLSEQSKNIAVSYIYYPSFLVVSEQFQLSKIAALATRQCLSKFISSSKDLSIKWPNDIYFQDKKIAGILIENSLSGNTIQHSVIGIGININQEKFPDEFNAISLLNILKNETEIENFFQQLTKDLDHYYFLLKSGNKELINKEYLSHLYKLAKLAPYRYKDEKINAEITGVNKQGNLELITDKNELIKADLKEIIFLHEP